MSKIVAPRIQSPRAGSAKEVAKTSAAAKRIAGGK